MSELSLTLLRLGFLLILWLTVFAVLGVMRRDLNAAERRPRRQKVTAVTPPNRAAGRVGKVVCQAESGKPFEVSLADGMTIGRDSSCQVLLGDDYASSVHARIERTDAGWLFTDLGSTNGSWQGHRRIEAPLLIKPGMSIRIGKTMLRFEK